MFFCSHCGSKNTTQTSTGNGGTIFVSEDLDTCEECFDPFIAMIECNDCSKITYPSLDEEDGNIE